MRALFYHVLTVSEIDATCINEDIFSFDWMNLNLLPLDKYPTGAVSTTRHDGCNLLAQRQKCAMVMLEIPTRVPPLETPKGYQNWDNSLFYENERGTESGSSSASRQ